MKKKLKDIFLNGILYFFHIEKNPISAYLNQLKKESDCDKMAKDWYNIGNDIKNACEKYKACC